MRRFSSGGHKLLEVGLARVSQEHFHAEIGDRLVKRLSNDFEDPVFCAGHFQSALQTCLELVRICHPFEVVVTFGQFGVTTPGRSPEEPVAYNSDGECQASDGQEPLNVMSDRCPVLGQLGGPPCLLGTAHGTKIDVGLFGQHALLRQG
jgi:hypothetical protein